jgi:hypothetical protein
MPRNYKKKNPVQDSASLQSAVQCVKEKKLSVRAAAAKYNVPASTIQSNLKRLSFQKHVKQRIFTDEQENEIQNHLLKASRINFGLTLVKARELAYQYAKALQIDYPPTWDRDQTAGNDFFEGFRKRHPKLSLRKPENTCMNRAYSFNPTNVNEFFDNLLRVLSKHKFQPHQIVNLDESPLSTVSIILVYS